MNILMTGCHGQLGRELIRASRAYDHTYIYTGRNGGEGPAEPDMTDSEAVERLVMEEGVDIILSCGWHADGIRILAGAAARTGVLLVHVSSAVTSEVEQTVADSGCRYMIFRTSWVYGDGEDSPVKALMERTASTPVLDIPSDRTGSPTFAPDLADAIFAVLESGRLDCTGVYDIAGEGVCSCYDFAKEVCDITGYLCEIRPCAGAECPPDSLVPRSVATDNSLIRSTFGICMPHWKDSLSFCISRMTKNGLLD